MSISSDYNEDAALLINMIPSYESDKKLICPGEFIFLLDRSGSMNGKPLKKSVEALELFL